MMSLYKEQLQFDLPYVMAQGQNVLVKTHNKRFNDESGFMCVF